MTGTVTTGGPNGPLAEGAPFTPAAVTKTAYTASPGDFVPVDTTGGAVTITLPAAPADQTVVAVKVVAQSGTNSVTVNTSAGDVFNVPAGATSITLALLFQGVFLQYRRAAGVWYVTNDSLPLSGLDARYVQSAGVATNPPSVVTPGAPTSGTPVTNTTGVDVQVYMAATAGSTAFTTKIGSTTLPGTTPVGQLTDVYLAAGQSITLTGAGDTFSWVWLAV